MAATTFTANLADSPRDISVTTGGTPGARGVTVIVDWTKVPGQLELINTLKSIERAVIERWPGIPSS